MTGFGRTFLARNIALLCIIMVALLCVIGFLLFIGIDRQIANSLYCWIDAAGLGAIVTQTIFSIITMLLIFLVAVFLVKLLRKWNVGNVVQNNFFVRMINHVHLRYITVLITIIGLINICFESTVHASTWTLIAQYVKSNPRAVDLLIFNDVIFGFVFTGFISVLVAFVTLKIKIISYLQKICLSEVELSCSRVNTSLKSRFFDYICLMIEYGWLCYQTIIERLFCLWYKFTITFTIWQPKILWQSYLRMIGIKRFAFFNEISLN